MSGYYDRTRMGGENGTFRTTCWIDIDKARTLDKQQRELVIANLLELYWKPVYCYIRRKGHSNEDAKDLTQSFFEEVVLGRDLIQQADQSKGRFRTFLLTALDHFMVNVYHRENTKKRSPDKQLIHFDQVDELLEYEAISDSADDMFNYAWACEILDQILKQTEDQCRISGKAVHWDVFRKKVLGPIIDGTESPPLSEICQRYDIDSEAKASNMIVTVKRRFSAVLKRVLRQYVESDVQIDEEFDRLLMVLSKSGAR